jgi:hypothetical protein
MKDKITLVMYSHSTYSDVWPMFFNQSEKLLTNYKKVLFCDDDLGILPEDWGFIKYNDDDNYSERVASCLAKIDTPLVFFHHEDMFLYDKPDKQLLSLYEDIVANENIDFIRLLRSVDSPCFNYKGIKSLNPVPSHSSYFFSVQPTICKTEKLLEIYRKTKINHIREFEPKVQQVCRNLKIKGLFHYDGEPKRGQHHYDSNVYPYVATAVVKGKWNLSGYPKELGNILKENNINVDKRGRI